jgi:hypothetical protein
MEQAYLRPSNWVSSGGKIVGISIRLPPNDVLFEKYSVTIQIFENARMRRLCSGKTLAFQAKDAGSIPARRSNYTSFPFGWVYPKSADFAVSW